MVVEVHIFYATFNRQRLIQIIIISKTQQKLVKFYQWNFIHQISLVYKKFKQFCICNKLIKILSRNKIYLTLSQLIRKFKNRTLKKKYFKQTINQKELLQKRQDMILNSQSLSNQSETFNDYRYQKALKQISKLINVNRQIKIQSEKFRYEYDQLAQKNTQLLEINSSLEQQNTMLRQQLQQLNITYCQLQQFCKKAQNEQKQLIKSNEIQLQQKIQIQQRHSAQIQQLEQHFREQINQIMAEMNNKDRVICQLEEKLQYVNELQAQNDKLHQRYQVALKQNDDLGKKCQQINKKCSQLNDKLINASTIIKHQPNQQLLNKLKINQQWIKSLNEQNYNLKQKVFEEEYKKQREKCSQTVFKNFNKDATTNNSLINLSSTNANDVLIKQYLKTIQKRMKKTQQEKTKIQSKYNKLKTKNHQLQMKCNSMQKQINLLTIKLSGYEQLAQRQQREIQQMIQEYHKQMDLVMNERRRIKSQHHLQSEDSLSLLKERQQNAIKREKQLKILIDNLQSQIIQNKAQTQQKDKLIKFLEMKVQSLQTERKQLLQRSNQQMDQSLLQQQSNMLMDLDKTSKNYHKSQNLLRTHSLTKSGGKVFVINGKKYETQVLKSNNSINSQEKQQQDSLDKNSNKNEEKEVKQGMNINEPKEGKKMIFPSGEVMYTSSQRNYSTDPLFVSGQKA